MWLATTVTDYKVGTWKHWCLVLAVGVILCPPGNRRAKRVVAPPCVQAPSWGGGFSLQRLFVVPEVGNAVMQWKAFYEPPDQTKGNAIQDYFVSPLSCATFFGLGVLSAANELDARQLGHHQEQSGPHFGRRELVSVFAARLTIPTLRVPSGPKEGGRHVPNPRKAKTVPYEFPDPTEENRNRWQAMVQEAIAKRELGWTKVTDGQWILSGNCPRCAHLMSNYFDLEVIVARVYGGDFFEALKETFPAEVVCTCEVDAPHRKDTKGCGWGGGLEIDVPTPEEA